MDDIASVIVVETRHLQAYVSTKLLLVQVLVLLPAQFHNTVHIHMRIGPG